MERELELGQPAQQRCEPAVADLARVAADREGALPACAGAEAIGAQLERGRAEQAVSGRESPPSWCGVAGAAGRAHGSLLAGGSRGGARAGRGWPRAAARPASPSSGVQGDVGAEQQLGCVGGEAGERDLGELAPSFARAEHEHDAAAVQRPRLARASAGSGRGRAPPSAARPSASSAARVDLVGLRVRGLTGSLRTSIWTASASAFRKRAKAATNASLLVRAAQLEAGRRAR